jgi:tRNA A37 threonylcarbamoyltransferase TsaD
MYNYKNLEGAMKNNYNRTVELTCPTCHGKDFDSTDGLATCKNCKRIFTSQQLQDANRAKINATAESVKKEVFNDIKTDFQKILKKSFGKNFKIK